MTFQSQNDGPDFNTYTHVCVRACTYASSWQDALLHTLSSGNDGPYPERQYNMLMKIRVSRNGHTLLVEL